MAAMAPAPPPQSWAFIEASNSMLPESYDINTIYPYLTPSVGQMKPLLTARGMTALSTSQVATQSFYTALQKRMIQTVATVTSSLTLVATLITFYWFCRMRKRLRHKYVSREIRRVLNVNADTR
jgi:hypothetical protein